jgi:hypothetical protein
VEKQLKIGGKARKKEMENWNASHNTKERKYVKLAD